MKKLLTIFTIILFSGTLLSACGTGMDPNVTEDTEEIDQEEMNPSVEESEEE